MLRGVFGLVGILVVIGVIAMIMRTTADHTSEVLKADKSAREVLTQVSGRDADGAPASASAVFDALSSGGKTTGLLVAKVTADGAYAHYFGIERNDVIVAFEFQGLRQNIKEISDSELAKAQVMETYQKHGSVYVMRGGKELKLPQAKTAEAPAAGQDAHSPPPAKKSAMERALDPIQSLQKPE